MAIFCGIVQKALFIANVEGKAKKCDNIISKQFHSSGSDIMVSHFHPLVLFPAYLR